MNYSSGILKENSLPGNFLLVRILLTTTRFENHFLENLDDTTNNVSVNRRQDIIISYCRHDSYTSDLHVSDINSGRLIAHVYRDDLSEDKKREIRDAMKGITALCYDEDTNSIYTGNENGMLMLWSN